MVDLTRLRAVVAWNMVVVGEMTLLSAEKILWWYLSCCFRDVLMGTVCIVVCLSLPFVDASIDVVLASKMKSKLREVFPIEVYVCLSRRSPIGSFAK